jgi:poly-gamma-glutamate capsule biosynthesis protein CapA/YwtB (metallophosphatase superfamily)
MKLFIPLVALVLLVATASPPAAATVTAQDNPLPPGGTFFDDDGNVHEGSIEAVAAAGITKGCGVADLYCPADTVTRGQVAAFLVRALHLPPSADDAFVDDDNSIFEANIQALAAAGITRGCGDRTYCPDRPVLRGELAALLVRAFHLPPSDNDLFVDDDNSIFEADIQALAAAGITFGCGEHRYCPNDPVRRDQMASFLVRALMLDPIAVPPRPTRILAFTGDTLIHLPVATAAAANGDASGLPYDFYPQLEPVASIISGADLAICHLEVPLSPTDTRLSGYPRFNAPRELADGLVQAGYDGCSTASNHALDQGETGLLSTLDILDQAGLSHAGTASSAAGTQATMYDLNGMTVAHLSATFSTNGIPEPSDEPWLVQDLQVDDLIAKAEAAKQAGADFVVVSVHCCVEYQTMPTATQRDIDRRLIESPAIDLVIGHHAHVVQPIERWDGEYIVYGLGNFLSAQHQRVNTADGVIVLVELTLRNDQWVVRQIRYVPTYVTKGDYRVLPDAETIAAGAGSLEATLRASWQRTVNTIETYNPAGVSPVNEP